MLPGAPIVESVREYLFAQPHTNTYVVLDGASIPRLPLELWKHEPEHLSLYRGKLEPDMAEVAPYLVQLKKISHFTDLVLGHGWGRHWGIFVITPDGIGLQEICRHFRRFLKIQIPDGTALYFRYYDPRVLRIYLPTCNAQELETIFGPIEDFILEGKTATTLMQFRRDGGILHTRGVDIA